jgi:hypothetical protein
MSAVDYATVSIGIIAIITAFAGGVKWLVKHFLFELKPNGGSTLKDSVIRLEEKVEILYQMMLQRGKD